MESSVTGEPMPRLMVRLSLPGILGMVLFGVNQIVDAVFVGRIVGELALAGVSVSLPIAQLFLGLGAMLGGGAGALVSIALGKRDEEQLRSILPTMNSITLIIGTIAAAAVFAFPDAIVRAMGGRGAVVGFGVAYLQVIAFGGLIQVWGLAGNFVVRAEGRLVRAMGYAGLGLVTNILLNALFVGVLDWGVVGAAWATNAGMVVYAVCNVLYFTFGRPSFHAQLLKLKFDGRLAGRILALGAPSLVLQLMAIVQQLTVFRLISAYGTASDIALFGAVFRIFFVATLPLIGMMRALQPVIGQNYGAGAYDRVRSAILVFGAGMLTVSITCAVLVIASPQAVVQMILPGRALASSEILDLRVFMSVVAFLPIAFLGITYFPAIGIGSLPALLALARQVLVFIPVAVVATRFLGISGVYRAFFWTDAVVTLVAGFLLIRHMSSLGRHAGGVETGPEAPQGHL